MKQRSSIAASIALAFSIGYAATVGASQTFQFDPDGTGALPSVAVGAFDWAVGNALAVMGNPSGGLAVGSKVTVLAQARLAILLGPGGEVIGLPAGTEFTYVAAFGETVATADLTTGNATFTFDPGNNANYFEIWTDVQDSNNLTGTGFNNGKRILFGQITNINGNFQATLPIVQFDQSPDGNNYGGQLTVTGSGSTDISVNVITVDADYFPGFGPDKIATLKAFFNTSNVVPFKQGNPSALFTTGNANTGSDAPPPSVVPNLGPVNGALQTGSTLDFQLQADANQSFEAGEIVAGACRVTYGGNDKNDNVDPNKFGSACSSDKGNKQNCYTFGGQVGAPTANPALGGPFGEHTHHQVQGPAGDFVFHAGTHSAPKSTRITATACKDPGACRQAEANAGFKQIDFEGTGSFRTLDAKAQAFLAGNGGGTVLPDNVSDRRYYFRVDMDDLGEPGNKASKLPADINACRNFFTADQNSTLVTPDPIFSAFVSSCSKCADIYQFYICKDENACEQKDAIYAVRGYLTGGNIQLHQVIK